MVTRHVWLVWMALVLKGVPVWAGVPSAVQFNRDIRPLLSQHCFQCHGPDEKQRKAKLRLDTREGLFSPRQGLPLIQPGQPGQSELIRRVTAVDPDDRMPPPETKKPLSAAEITLLTQWIEQGAPYSEHWSFVAPTRPDLPLGRARDWARNPIDLFVLDELEAAGLEPNAEADRRTLIRRVTLDLTGLPPSLDEVERFVNDPSPGAYERVVDRLLESERYGERMTVAWMDAARYGDSSVFHADGVRDMWPWRDWVIRAFNENMPFDRFTIEQLAGDLLPDPTIQQRVASGFNRNHGTTDEGGAIPEEYRVEYVVDRVKTTATVWLGLTMECGQCHDHKYDPISQKEYYQFFAYFNRTKDPGMQTRGGNQAPIVHVLSQWQETGLTWDRVRRAQLEARRREEKPASEEVVAWATWQRETPAPAPPLAGPWHRLGPFTVGNAKEAFDREFGPEKEPFDRAKAFGGKTWEPQPDWLDGQPISLELPDNSAVYLYRVLTASQAGVIGVSLGSDDSCKVWLNGQPLLATNASRAVAPDQDRLALNLQAGPNHFLMKIGNGGGGSGFYFRLGGAGFPKEIESLLVTAATDWEAEDRAKVEQFYTQMIWPEGLQWDAEIRSLRGKETALLDSVPTCMVMEDMEQPRPTYLLARGHYASPVTNQVIEPAIPAFLPALPEDAPPNRLALAKWLVDPQQPLTARVTINRFWEILFGAGLVATPGDFGMRGEWPTHPELLDWLAVDFVESGWDVKRALKQIVLSATYRQSPRVSPEKLARDPLNRLLSRAPRLRLQAEFVRDNVLALSGLLQEEVGGPSVKPYQPPGIWNEVALDGNLRYVRDAGEKLFRRGMYIYWKRSAPAPSMLAFDAPTREKCTVQRPRTNTPLQALVTLNGVEYVEAAREFAHRIIREAGPDFRSRLDHAFLLATARPADDVRTASLKRLYERQLEVFSDPVEAENFLSFGDQPRDKTLDQAELAAWTTVGSVILNLDEVLTKE